jgi:hypothetical protein
MSTQRRTGSQTGLAGVYELAFKAAHPSSRTLLDSYTEERRHVAKIKARQIGRRFHQGRALTDNQRLRLC